MRNIGLVALLFLGCGSGNETAPPTPIDGAVDTSSNETTNETAGETATDSSPVDSSGDAADTAVTDSPTDGGGSCGVPTWHPTACADCGGGSSGTTCNQACDPTTCGDKKAYRAECDELAGTCQCYIDDKLACTCTSKFPKSTSFCEPEEWGGRNCCWNVG